MPGFSLGPGPDFLILEASRQPRLVPKPERMTSDGATSLPGPDMTLKPGTALSPFTALPIPPSAPGPPDQPPWELPPQPPMPSALSPGNPLMISAFPNPLLVTGDGGPGHSGAEASKVIVKVKKEGGAAESSHIQNFILTQTSHNWIASGAPCGGPEGPSPQFVTASNMKALLPTEAVVVSQEGLPGLPAQAPPPAAHLVPIVSLEKAWPGPHGSTGEGGLPAAQSKPALGDLSYTSNGVYENFRRWQLYKALARRHLSQSPDAEALSCFLIPVLRSLARLKPTMTLEEGLPRAVQEWDRTSNFDRMIFYEMAEKFMEFEAEEEMQNQNTQLMNGSQGLPPAVPLKLDPPGPQAPEVCQQPVYIPKKATSKARAPRQRQRKTQRPPVPQAPKEIPPEAVKEYADIMEGLVGSHLATGESEGRQEEEERQQEEGMYPDPDLLSYIDELCSQEVFVSKVEAVIHPQFLADLLSPEQQRDPLALMEELEQEEELSLAQLVQKRLLALEEEEGAEAPLNCSGAHLDSSPSVSDEDEDAGGRLRPSPGLRVAGGAVCLGKAASPGKQARTVHGGQEQALDGSRMMCRDGNNLPSPSGWDLHIELAAPQGTRVPLGTERREPGKITNQIAPHQDDYLGGAGSPGHCLVADGTCEALSLCWQEGSQLELVPSLDVGLAELTPLQGQGLEKQVLGLQTEQQIGSLGVLAQGKELLALPQEGSSGVMWGDDRGLPIVQSYEQNFPSRTAEDKYEDGASFSPGLWLSSEMDAISLELPLQIEEVLENFHDGECVPEHQGGCQTLGSRSDISLGPGETTAHGDVGSSALPCGGTDATAALEKRNYSLALRSKEQNPETLQDSSDLWAEGCPPLLESSIDASTLVSKETLPPSCQGNIFILGIQDASSFPEASQEAGNRGSSISLLETIDHSNILDARDGCGLQLGGSEDTCPLNFNSYDCQREGREDTDLLNPKDLAPLPGNRESYAHRTPKSTSPRSLGRTSRRWGARDALVLKASPVSETRSSAGRAKRKKEDEELSRVAYLLASKLSLSPRQTSLSPRPASGLSSTGQGVQRASDTLSPEARGPGQSPHPVAKSKKRALVTGPIPAEKRPYLGAELAVSGEKPPARPSQPRKRRRDSLGTGRRKKRRRSQ
ncbi:NUT midline carcinoma family member 1 [Phyllostomus discolor]|uniref:NUT midline carcinoma family member 1 n=1 Tax=Phyllostomus discolor TaxID=89673 RepID=A0A834BPK6_9CHIR|nr:NUT midline carcinoma family member 1 [Phyllostomus discolor]